MREWNEFISFLNLEFGEDVVKKWMPSLIRFDAANVYLSADSFQQSWFEEHVRPKLKNLVNHNQRPIKVHLIALAEKKTEEKKEITLNFYSDLIDPEMSLENFAQMQANIVAYKILNEPASFNPIFLFGPKNSGKTHLLMGSALLLKKQQKKVLYIRAETFTSHVIQAIRLGKMQEFRKHYRDIDALFIDDVHDFAKKNATQEEFFHTFNTLHISGKLIVLSANTPPSKLKEIEPRLVSRFEWGISLEVGKADPLEVLQKKMKLWNMDLKPEIQTWLVEKFSDDPILALSALHFRAKEEIKSLEVAKLILRDLLEKQSENVLSPDRIISFLAVHFDLTPDDILGKSQLKTIAFARQYAMYFCRKKLNLTYKNIGELFQRDHSTVMSSIKQIEKGLEENKIDPLESLIQ